MSDSFFGSTDTGKLRDNNEDAFIAQPIAGGRYIAACVIDGVGGYEGGEIAAGIAKETIVAQLQTDTNDLLHLMKQALIVANEKIYTEKANNRKNDSMACVATLAVADLTNNQFYYAHVGDTRLYLFRDHSLVKVTRDHSFVGFLEDSKRLSEKEAMRHPKRNEINKALGFDPDIAAVNDYIETGVSPFLPGDMLLVCSDGLSDMVDSASITAILTSQGSIAEKTKELIQAANKAGGKDNITVVLVQNNKKPVVQKATKPVLVKKNKPPEEKAEPVPQPAPIKQPVKAPNKIAIPILTVLCIALAGVVIWLWQKEGTEKGSPEQSFINPISRNATEQKLVDSLNAVSVLTVSDSAYANPVIISDTIFIQKDSLHLIGNGIVLRSDSAYKGPAFVIDSTCKNVILENIVLENFDIGLIAKNRALHLKNVRFNHCRVPVQYYFLLPSDVPVSGTVSDSLFIKSDSLPKANRP